MKKLGLFILGLGLATCLGIFFFLPGAAEKKVLSMLHDNGFEAAQVSKAKILPGGLSFQTIQLDADGFSLIEGAKIQLNWFTYILQQKVDSITISKIIHHALSDQMNPGSISQWVNTKSVMTMPVNTLNIELAQLNLATSDFGDIRIEAKALVKTLDDGSKTIQAVTWSRQYQLGFQIPISGVIKANEDYLFESTFNEGKLNIGPLRISRLSGWASLEGRDMQSHTFSTQLDAGSADILGMPLQDLSFAFSESPNSSNSIFRSNASGMQTVKLAADWNQDQDNAKGALFFDVAGADDLKKLIAILLPDFNPDTLKQLGEQPLTLKLQYQPDRRFAGGPIPFALSLKDKKSADILLEGSVLIYPDSLDVKGSVFGNNDVVNDISTLTGLKADSTANKTIPVDFNLKNLIQNHMQKNQG